MKARLVNESIRFERGLNPKKALKIGRNQQLLKAIEKEEIWNDNHYSGINIDSLILKNLKRFVEKGDNNEIIAGTGKTWIVYYDAAIKFLEEKYNTR